MTHGSRTLSYGELWDQIQALSSAYRSLGIVAGNRVVCQLPTSPEHLIAACAAWECGAIHVGAHKDLTGTELAALAGRVGARAMVFSPPAGRRPRAVDPLALHLGSVPYLVEGLIV